MTDLNERVLDQATSREIARTEDLLVLVERHDDRVDDGPGVPVDRLRAYADEIVQQGGPIDADHVDAALERRTDSKTWVGADVIYEVGDGRVSTYPANWYERLSEGDDLEEHLRAILLDIVEHDEFEHSQAAFPQGGPGNGVPEGFLLNVTATIGKIDREEARNQLARLRDEEVVVEHTDQHPNSRVQFLEREDESSDE